MSRRRGSATALKLSEVVAARDMGQLYVDMGICQADAAVVLRHAPVVELLIVRDAYRVVGGVESRF